EQETANNSMPRQSSPRQNHETSNTCVLPGWHKSHPGAELPFNNRISGMIMDGLEVFSLDPKTLHTGNAFKLTGDIAHQIFDEFGVFVSTFGNVLFVVAFEQSPKLA